MIRGCEDAVILAAGAGTRVRSLTRATPKCLLELRGKPIIGWILTALRRGGIKRVAIVTGFKAGMIRQEIGSGTDYGLTIDYVHNPRWRLPNGRSLYAARHTVPTGRVFLTLMSDHLLSPGIIRKVAMADTSRCLLAVDTRVDGIFDLSDATKVRISGSKPVAIGKRLKKYNAVDCGLFRFDDRIFGALKSAAKKGRMALTDGVKILIEAGDLEVLPAGRRMFWIDIDTPHAYKHASEAMDRFLRTLGKRFRT